MKPSIKINKAIDDYITKEYRSEKDQIFFTLQKVCDLLDLIDERLKDLEDRIDRCNSGH
jgi:hypothetical protein